MIELEQDAQMEIAKLKPLIPNSTEKEDAISLLETGTKTEKKKKRKE